MATAGTIIGVMFWAFIFILAIVVMMDNTRVLNEHKALRAELDDIQRQANEIGPNPTDEQVAALNTRIDNYKTRFDVFQRSPFVITRRT